MAAVVCLLLASREPILISGHLTFVSIAKEENNAKLFDNFNCLVSSLIRTSCRKQYDPKQKVRK